MEVFQVNLGKSQMIESDGETYETGIYKHAVKGRVSIGSLGLEADVICDAKYHGGVDQAVYLYSMEDYAWFESSLSAEFPPGTFGENVTTQGLDLSALCVGDVLTSSELTLQVTAPRIPCNTLESRIGQRGFAKKFMQALRCGVYCRVLKTGSVAAGDVFELTPFNGERVTIPDFMQDMTRKLDEETLKKYLSLPIDERNRADFEEALAKLG